MVIEDDRNLYVIEAKLYSDFGEDSNGPSQLRREWSDGFVRAENAAKNLWLITVTNHATLPTFALRRQLTNSDADPTRVCWLSWSNIGLLLRSLGDESEIGWRDDILKLLSRLGLAPFDGFGDLTSLILLSTGEAPWAAEVLLARDGPKAVGFVSAISAAQDRNFQKGAEWKLNLE